VNSTTRPITNVLQHRWYAYLLSLLSGALTTIAFAPFNLFPVSLITTSLLFFLWLHSSTSRAFKHGFLFGVGLYGTGVYWIYYSMSQFGGVPLWLAIILTSLLVLFLALFPALAGYLFQRFFQTSQTSKAWLIIMPSLFVLFEWIRGWIFTGFPWMTLGYSQIDTPLNGYTPIVGVFGLSWILLICSALLVYMIENGKAAIKFSLLSLIIIIASGAILGSIEWTRPAGEPLKVSLLQGNISQDKKWLADQRQPTIEWYTRATRENWSSDFVVWPETALPAFYHQAKSFLDGLQEEALQNNTDLLLGIPMMDPDNKQYYNGVISLGKQPGVYHKQHLVPFGEFIPFESLLGNILKVFDVPMPNFSHSDNKNRILNVANHQIGISICYEDVFGEEIIVPLPEVSLLVNVSNDAWFGDSIAPHQHLQIAQMRAVESGRPLLRATNTGVTAFIDHHGKIQSKLPQFVAQTLTDTTQPMSGSTPYSLLGNWLIVSSIFVILLVVSFWKRP